MPHQCRECEHVIPNESEHLLSGCPHCKNQSWEYVESVNKNSDTNQNVDKSQQHTQNKIQPKNEDESQTAARTEFVDSDNLPSPSVVEGIQNTMNTDANEFKPESVRKVDNVSKVQEQLNKQYEGIKVVRNGKYKINLTELYRGNDYIIEIGDDGAYTVSKASKM
jgi:predicted  nucleic acid-binding Zn-ribbon protein